MLGVKHSTVFLQVPCFVLVVAKASVFQLQVHCFHHKVKNSATATKISLNKDNGNQNHNELNIVNRFCQSTDDRAGFIQDTNLFIINPVSLTQMDV